MEPWHWVAGIGFTILMALISSTAKAGVIEGGSTPSSALRSIANLLDSAPEGEELRIVYVHGMRADGPGFSLPFRQRLCEFLGVGEIDCPTDKPHERMAFDVVDGLEELRYAGEPIWRNQAEAQASRPFTDRYRIIGGGRRVVVDEFNWWPLLFPLKCRLILRPEYNLAGPDDDHLSLCARDVAPYHPWITREELEKLKKRRPISGGGACVNKKIKQEILDWGVTDAVISLGEISKYLRNAVDQAFAYAAEKSDASVSHRYVVVSESLGSFVVLDAFAAKKPAVRSLMNKAQDLYFFANQVAVLELARIERTSDLEVKANTDNVTHAVGSSSLFGALAEMASPGGVRIEEVLPKNKKQIIAFSDPSDMLTFHVPDIRGWQVSNLYVRNGWDWFGLFAEPGRAHTGHTGNPEVLDVIFRRKPPVEE